MRLFDAPMWALAIVIAIWAVLLVQGIVFAIVRMSGKDIWPYTTKGPLRGNEEEAWIKEAIAEYAKKVPYPGTSTPIDAQPERGQAKDGG